LRHVNISTRENVILILLYSAPGGDIYASASPAAPPTGGIYASAPVFDSSKSIVQFYIYTDSVINKKKKYV
jgi:hypothetical protein